MGLQDLINKYDNGGFSKTGWFQLKDDGDTATVRLLHASTIPALQLMALHTDVRQDRLR